jgi:hypothetical protein
LTGQIVPKCFVHHKRSNSYEKIYNFRIKSGMCKMSISICWCVRYYILNVWNHVYHNVSQSFSLATDYSEWVIGVWCQLSNFSAISWQGTSYFYMRWWRGPLYTRPTRLVGFFYSASWLKQQSVDRHVASLGHIILITSQPVFVLTP